MEENDMKLLDEIFLNLDQNKDEKHESEYDCEKWLNEYFKG